MSERLRLTDISIKRESPERLKPGRASKSEVVDANTDVEEETHKVAVFHRTERPVRDIPQVFDKIHRRNAHRLEEIIRGSGCMTFGFDIWINWDFKRVRSVQGIYLDIKTKLAKRVQRVQLQLSYHQFLHLYPTVPRSLMTLV